MPVAYRTLASTLSGDLTLTDSSETLHLIDGNGAVRDVNLPAEAGTNPNFVLVNVGFYRLRVLNDGGTIIGIIEIGGQVECYSDGTDWIVLGGFDRYDMVVQTYNYGGRVNTDNDYAWANGQYDNTPGTGDTQASNFHAVTDDGVLACVSWRSQNALEAVVFAIHVNQVRVAWTEPMIGQAGVVKIAQHSGHNSGFGSGVVALSAGDELSIRYATSGQTDPIDMTLQLGVYAPGGHNYTFGSSVAAGGFYKVNDIANQNTGTPARDETTEHTVAVAGTIHAIAYRTQNGTATSQMQLYVNGTGQGAFNLDASGKGVETVSIAVSAGDTIAVEHVSTAQDNGDATVGVAISNAPGQLYFFGANINTANAYYKINGDSDSGVTGTTLNEQNEATMMRPGTLTVSWRNAVGTGGTYELWKNGVSQETFGDLTASSGTASLTTTVMPGDQIAISATDASVGNGSLVLAVEQ
jgi:hypothetical protein